MKLPFDPMAPITNDRLPEGPEWGYQLKWDGVRIIALLDHGSVQLYSRNMLLKNSVYPELVQTLSAIPGQLVLDGEAVVFDTVKQRPVFQKVLQRERMRVPGSIRLAGEREPVQYVLFDVLEIAGRDIRREPYRERNERLRELFPERKSSYFVTDLFDNGQALWDWVDANEWEGVVSKRLDSPYLEGKKHNDWFKKKTFRRYNVRIIGYTFREGRLASLIMLHDNAYFGKVSQGLNTELKRRLTERYPPDRSEPSPFAKLPEDLRRDRLVWISPPFDLTVAGQEVSEAGLLRHPRIDSWGGLFDDVKR